MLKKTLGALTLVVLTLSACGQGEIEEIAPTAETAETVESTPEASEETFEGSETLKRVQEHRKKYQGSVPLDYVDKGDGLGAIVLDEDETNCDVETRCFNVKIYAHETCNTKVYAEMSLMDKSDVVIDSIGASLGTLEKGDYGLVTLPITNDKVEFGKLVKVICE